MITVDMALEQGKEVYALPGRVTDALSEGCNRLLQQGAGIALSPQEIVKTLMEKVSLVQDVHSLPAMKRNDGNAAQIDDKCPPTALLTDVQSDILRTLEEEPQPAEIIKKQMLLKSGCDLPMPELLNQLIKLCLFGLAKQVGNSYFVKN